MSKPSSPAFDVPLSDLVSVDQIVDGMKATDVKQGIEELVSQLESAKMVDSSSTAVKRIMERERLAPTALGSGVAIPHARMDVGEKPVFAIGRHFEGIDFGALDDKPVELVFLLVGPESDNSRHVRMLSRASLLFCKSGLREAMLEASTPEELLSLIEDAEGGLDAG